MSTVAIKEDDKVRIVYSVHTPDYKGAVVNPVIPDCELKYMDIIDGKLVKISKVAISAIDLKATEAAEKTTSDRQAIIDELKEKKFSDNAIDYIMGGGSNV